jgi:5-formyltetrahydrofolate cyclo-ligase
MLDGGMNERKQRLRKQARAARTAIDAETSRAHAEAAAENLLGVPGLASARIVLAYAATPEELDPRPAVEALYALGSLVALPRIEGPGVLGAHLVEPDASLEAGPMGIAQPPGGAPRAEFESIDAVIVPGVAYDEEGRRLGYGGGYYDRLIPRLRPDCLLVGFAFDEQVLEALPAEEHDRRVDALVTPTRVFLFSETD